MKGGVVGSGHHLVSGRGSRATGPKDRGTETLVEVEGPRLCGQRPH